MVVLIITGRFNVTVRCPWQDEDVTIALQAATQMAERWGEDMAIMSDLSVRPLKEADTPPLEIVRCPAALKKAANRR
jgi:hypothetical protein